MTAALYADYVADLKAVFSELDRRADLFQSFDVRLELAAAGGLVVYETKRRKGQTDSLYYGRATATSANQQISQATAFAAIDRFFALGQFVALTARPGGKWTRNTRIAPSISPIARRGNRPLDPC